MALDLGKFDLPRDGEAVARHHVDGGEHLTTQKRTD